MPTLTPLLRALLLSFLLTSAHAVPPRLLFDREDTCASKKLTSCPSDLPDNFCCSPGTTCITLAGGTTALCCPDGSNCDRITPLSCDVSAQDPDKFPDGGLKTTALDGDLERCGEECCPYGYSCNDDDVCQMNEDQSEPPDPEAPSQTKGSSKPTAEGSTDDDNKDEDAASTTAIIIGACLGTLALFSAVVFFFIWRCKRRKKAGSSTGDPKSVSGRQSPASSHVPNISAPIIDDRTLRSDFLNQVHTGSTGGTDLYHHSPPLPKADTGQSSTAVHPTRGLESRFSELTDDSSRSRRGRESAVSAVSEAPRAYTNPRDTSLTGMLENAGLEPVHRGHGYLREYPPRI